MSFYGQSQYKAASFGIFIIEHQTTVHFSMMRRPSANPSPVPVENVSILAKRSNTKSCLSWGIPIPVSVTEITNDRCLGLICQLSVMLPFR